jgi:hypothetical protein
MSMPYCPRKCSSSCFLPRIPTTFQEASRNAFVAVRLGRAAILGYEKNNDFQHRSYASWPIWEGWDGCKESRVSSTHGLRGRLYGRSEISIVDCLEWFGSATWVCGCKVFVAYEAFRTLVTGICLGLTVTFGVELTELHFGLCTTTFGVGAVIGSELGMGSVGVALTTRPPRMTWVQPGPRISCSAVSFGAVVLGALPSLLPIGVRFASDALASFHFTQPRKLAMRFPPQLQHLCCCFEEPHSPEG